MFIWCVNDLNLLEGITMCQTCMQTIKKTINNKGHTGYRMTKEDEMQEQPGVEAMTGKGLAIGSKGAV
ncbi:hypothetical protein ECA0864 [Pectobacterium atrosepticum SCRI1043]|uniref:Uncharacterized protein n=1 Tax=Pectobacterium atrosepticum (strain SCRI 1043 / ATCC BAA-672) TaxID=218491 RepID=Q6D8V8_PECAS|nr:hypothetical protein ECA0864 [Pectobacterium atrosepticum SCRI1043]